MDRLLTPDERVKQDREWYFVTFVHGVIWSVFHISIAHAVAYFLKIEVIDFVPISMAIYIWVSIKVKGRSRYGRQNLMRDVLSR